MNAASVECLGSLFLAAFCVCLAMLSGWAGMDGVQWTGAGVAICGSVGLALAVRRWPRRCEAVQRR